MRQSEIDTIANDVSNLVVNRVLAKELNIGEALSGILTSPLFVYAKTLPESEVDKILENGETIARMIMSILDGQNLSPAVLTYALSLVSRAMMENTKK